MAKKQTFNPFYLLLLVAGTAFTVTACAYGVLILRDVRLSRRVVASSAVSTRDAREDRFGQLVDAYGPRILVVELLLLTVGTVGAIAHDQVTETRRQAALTRDGKHSAGQAASHAASAASQQGNSS